MQERRKSYTIAVVIPMKEDDQGTAEALLRGAAQIQEDFNKNTAHPGLKVIIVDDNNNPDTVRKLAENLLSKDDIVAVFGHYTSELTKKALPVYQQKKSCCYCSCYRYPRKYFKGSGLSRKFLISDYP